MSTILITGASHGIGQAVARDLLEKGNTVYSVSRTPSSLCYKNHIEKNMDLTDKTALTNYLKTLTDVSFDILINNAGAAYYGLCEDIKAGSISEMTAVNLEVPMLITNFLLRKLKDNKGLIINIASTTARSVNPHGSVYGATKAALLSFSDSIFEEGRKHGLRVCTILPDMTDTELYRNADFECDSDEYAHLKPEDVASAVDFVINSPSRLSVREIRLMPVFHRIKRKKTNV